MTMLLIRILLVCALSSVASPVLASCLGSGDAEIEALAIQEAKTLPSDHPALLHLQIANLYGADSSPSILENLYELPDQKMIKQHIQGNARKTPASGTEQSFTGSDFGMAIGKSVHLSVISQPRQYRRRKL